MAVIAAIQPGETLAGYRIESVIGRGGMGIVYRATDLSLDRPVALKVIAPELAEDDRFRARFLREPRLAASLDHPGVVPIYEAGQRNGQLYLAMRYVEGSDLRAVIRREGRLDPEPTFALLAQIADALDAAHRRGLVHRDVKPGNMLVDSDGHAYLTDFGITKQLGDAPGEADADGVVGTLDYLAPEQIRGETVDGRADCYALGCVLYECLAGAPPFRRETEAETLWAQLRDEPPTLVDHPALDATLRKALAKEPADRFEACTELIAAGAAALGLRDQRQRVRGRGVQLLFVGSLLLVAATLAVLIRSAGRDGTAANTPALDAATNSLGALDVRTGRLAFAVPLPGRATDIAARDGTAWVTTVDSTAVTGVSAKTRSITQTVPLKGRADAVAVGAGSVWVADAGGGVVSRITPGYDRVVRISVGRGERTRRQSQASLAVSQDAVWLADGSRRLIGIDPRTYATVTLPVGSRVDALASGGGVLWAIASDSATVLRIDPRTRRVTDRVAISAPAGNPRPSPIAVAASPRAIWVLNAGVATLTQIDPTTLSVAGTTPIGVDRAPADVTATGSTAWVANRDGSIVRVTAGSTRGRETRVGESIEGVAADVPITWVTTAAFDRKLPGGDR